MDSTALFCSGGSRKRTESWCERERSLLWELLVGMTCSHNGRVELDGGFVVVVVVSVICAVGVAHCDVAGGAADRVCSRARGCSGVLYVAATSGSRSRSCDGDDEPTGL